MYNTLMGVCAGLALVLLALLGKKLTRREVIAPEGWALAFGIVGVVLTFLSGLMAVTWPLTVNPPLNILFAEPSLMLGVMLIAASIFLAKQKTAVNALASTDKKVAAEADIYLRRVLAPVSWIIFGVGLILAFSTIAIFRFTIVGSAPAAEPISGLLHDYPLIENTFFGILYGLPTVGALLTPLALRKPRSRLPAIVGYSWAIAGVSFLLFSALNYYTHSGMLINMLRGTNFTF
jgi:hypothetical protein